MRILTQDTPDYIDKIITVQGWVHARRDHGKLIFVDLRDRTGLLQVVIIPQVSAKAHEIAGTLRPESVISIKGLIKARPAKLVNDKIASGTVEMEAREIEILAPAETLPFDMGGDTLNLELPTLLDHRSLTLRHERVKNIFKIQSAIADAFRKAAVELNATEIFIPTIAAGATEGGSEVFEVNYYGHKAYMTQSPQLYKQIMVSVLERVFVITKAYRAEPSVTTRHLSEVTMMDVEIAFIQSFEELLDALEFVGTSMVRSVSKQYADVLEQFGVEKAHIPVKIPRLKMREAQAIVTERTGRDLSKELDLNPEDEKEICNWAREMHNSDFVTVTHYPTKKRAFYTYADPQDPTYSLSYDLLFKGAEILSGSRRINDYADLVSAMKAKDVDPDNFGMYLQAFRYGMPPEGGFSFGLERLTMKLLELSNVREASLFPRDMERVDERFSVSEEKTKKVHKGKTKGK